MTKPIFFHCPHCHYRLKADEDSAGDFARCPQCHALVEVPEPEGGPRLYRIAGEPADPAGGFSAPPGPRPPAGPASTDIWHPGKELELPPSLRPALDQAQVFGETDQEAQALALLLRMGRNGLLSPENRLLRRPSALCLVRWAQKMLDWLEAQRVELSPPLRRLLRRAADNQRWGIAFNFRQCALCEKPLGSLLGRVKLKTTAGVAYLCCAGPDRDDFVLVQLLDTIWQAVSLAGTLDPDNRDVPLTLEALPAWHKVLLTPDTRSSWCGVIRERGESKLSNLGPEVIDPWLAEHGFASEEFLMQVYLCLALANTPDNE